MQVAVVRALYRHVRELPAQSARWFARVLEMLVSVEPQELDLHIEGSGLVMTSYGTPHSELFFAISPGNISVL